MHIFCRTTSPGWNLDSLLTSCDVIVSKADKCSATLHRSKPSIRAEPGGLTQTYPPCAGNPHPAREIEAIAASALPTRNEDRAASHISWPWHATWSMRD